MGMFDKMKDKAGQMASENKDKLDAAAEQAVQKTGDAVDSVTGGKFADKVDEVQAKADQEVDSRLDEQ